MLRLVSIVLPLKISLTVFLREPPESGIGTTIARYQYSSWEVIYQFGNNTAVKRKENARKT